MLTFYYLQIYYYTQMHMWKDSIFSTETRLINKRLGRDQSPQEMPNSDAENEEYRSQATETRECCAYYRLVHVSENSWLMGKLVTSQITLIVLPSCLETLGKKILAGVRKNKWFILPTAIFVPVALLFAIVVFHIMLVFIAASIGGDILMMMGKLFCCPKSKTGSANRPEVSSNITDCSYKKLNLAKSFSGIQKWEIVRSECPKS
jgi:hypothetical protein